MQDIRKPYSHSRSNRDLAHRVKEFEENSYDEEEEDVIEQPVHIPKKTFRDRRNIDNMEMFPRRRKEDFENEARGIGQGEINYRDPRTRYVKRETSVGTWAFIITIVVLAVLAWLLTYVFNSATITIVPKHEDIADFRKTLSFGTEDSKLIPFIVATSSMTKSKVLPLSETKKVESKASGKIVIYNNFSAEPQRLIKNTRFEATGGKIYRINDSVTVPGKKGETPGSIEVTVYADSYGSDYNIAPTDFTIPGFKNTPRYTGFFARSNGPMSGGASGNTSLASLTDMNAAKDELEIEMAQKIKSEFESMKKEGYVGLYSAIDIVYSDNEEAVLQGVTSTYEVTATGYLMFASEPEFAKSVALSIRDYNGEDVRLAYTDTLSYSRKDTDRIAGNTKLDILVEGTPRIIWNTNADVIKGLVAGKKRDEFKPIMKTIDSVENAEIGFSPMWLSTFPDDKDKISIVESLPKR
jgi:hypothetical protein